MRITKHFMVCVMLLDGLFLLSCSKKDVEDGWVKFDFLGNTYTITQQQLMIRANPMIGEGERMKTIEKGKRINFEFHLGPTPSRAKQEIEDTGKQLKQALQSNIPKTEGVSKFFAVWCIETDDPIETLKNKISYDTPGLNLGPFPFGIQIPGYHIANLPKEKHNCWVTIDEITDNRIKGKFGGIFEVNSLNDISMLGKEVEITNSTFDVPLKKLYQYK